MDLQECINDIVERVVYEIVEDYLFSFFYDVTKYIYEYSDDSDEFEDDIEDKDYVEDVLDIIVRYELKHNIKAHNRFKYYAKKMCVHTDKCNEILEGVGMPVINAAAVELGIDVNTADACQLAYAVLVSHLPNIDIAKEIVDYIAKQYDVVNEAMDCIELI